MNTKYENFAFSGGGVFGIAYIGMLDYLYEIGLMPAIQRVAGTSAGAITACITAFNLSFQETKEIADSLNYSKVPAKTDPSVPQLFSRNGKRELDRVFVNADCAYRLIKKYGWYSSSYFYDWIKRQIAKQFDVKKKAPPYTFLDFQNPSLHRDGRPFKELYMIGTDVSTSSSSLFCATYTPHMEVAEAVRISMSVPLFFEAIKSAPEEEGRLGIFADGGLMYNYPISLFDGDTPDFRTIGALFNSSCPPLEIHNLLDYIVNLLSCSTAIQTQLYNSSPENRKRSIQINTGDVNSMDFDIKTGDKTYTFLYEQGYRAAKAYFKGM